MLRCFCSTQAVTRHLPLLCFHRCHTFSTSAAAVPAVIERNAEGQAVSYVHPQSPISYSQRLEHKRYSSMVELLRTPYSPRPLKILLDLTSRGLCSAASREEMLVMTDAAVDDVRSVVASWKARGDIMKEEELRACHSLVGQLSDWLFESPSAKELTSSALLICHKGDVPAMDVVLAGLCRMASMLGLWRCCVLSLQVLGQVQTVKPRGEDPQMYICAIQGCRSEHVFDVALNLFRAMSCQTKDGGLLSEGLCALIECSGKRSELDAVRAMFAEEFAACVPVSVGLYTALIDACARLADSSTLPFAMSLYRTVRDVGLRPDPEMYAALMGVCAAASDATQAFAFYCEARKECSLDPNAFPPALFNRLIQAYVNGGFVEDAFSTFFVLIGERLPVDRSTFHVMLRSARNLREAHEVVDRMVREPYCMAPSATTYALLMDACQHSPRGVTTLLCMHDIHTKALAVQRWTAGGSSDGSDPLRGLSEDRQYASSVERALLRISLEFDTMYDAGREHTVRKVAAPLMWVAQQNTNLFVGFPPQRPTLLPAPRPVVAVLCADALENISRVVEQLAGCATAMVVPYSAMATFRAKFSEECHDAASARAHTEALRHFMQEYREAIHLVSLEEELSVSKEMRRFAIPLANTPRAGSWICCMPCAGAWVVPGVS